MRHKVHSFDTHRSIKELQQAGFNEQQAESIIRSLLESRDNDISNLATKEQISALEAKFDTKLDALESKMATKDQVNSLENRVAHIEKTMATKEDLKSLEIKIVESQNTIIKWVLGSIFAFSGMILGALKLFFH